jgi:hypothetical protein
MFNPSRRNRNIGTPKQGHGQDNELTIPESWYSSLRFYEKLNEPVFVKTGSLTICVEKTRNGSIHACTVEDLIHLLNFMPPADINGLGLIVLRQPKRKEETLNPVWGRLIYSYELSKKITPAIVIEAIALGKKFLRSKKMSIESQQEFLRLKNDGHLFVEDKASFVGEFTLDATRNTQLYRTFFHEVGHFVQYQQRVLDFIDETSEEQFEKIESDYFHIPTVEKETFAHKYAAKICDELNKNNHIPFERQLNDEFLDQYKLRKSDFFIE